MQLNKSVGWDGEGLRLQSKSSITVDEIGLAEATLVYLCRHANYPALVPERGDASDVEGYTHLGLDVHRWQGDGHCPGTGLLTLLYRGMALGTWANDVEDSWSTGSINVAQRNAQYGINYRQVTYRAKGATERYMAGSRPSAPTVTGSPTILVDGAAITLPHTYDFGPAEVAYTAEKVLSGFTVKQRGNAFEVAYSYTGRIVETWTGGFPAPP